MTETPRRRIGVYVCRCGGNISDFVDVAQVVDSLKDDADVVVAREAMFTCSDATQQEIVDDISSHGLDGMVVASCSPKLHQHTFREVARRAGLNPFEYTQVNVREQCSWTHTDDREGATAKALGLVRAGIAHTRLSEPLEPTTVETTSAALVIGGGVAGMRASIALADVGLHVYLVESQPHLGGWAGRLGATYPRGEHGADLAARLEADVRSRPTITVFTEADVVGKSGTYGNYQVTVRTRGEDLAVEVGQVIVATGFDEYRPADGELGFGTPGVLELSAFDRLLDESDGPIRYRERPIRSIAYVYCVGSRDEQHPYCSRFCCTAAVHASVVAARRSPSIRQYHLYRDMRTYGANEALYADSRRRQSVFLRFSEDDPPTVTETDDGLLVTVRDSLTAGEELAIPVDLVVLVTGMVPRANDDLVRALRLPVGRDGFFNEIHPKLRPVETVVDGVLICGACQGPKSIAESVASGLAAAAHTAAVLKRGVAELDPQVATVHPETCTGCEVCITACPFGAISLVASPADPSGSGLAVIDPTACKGCGGCVPACPDDAIDLLGHTDAQVRQMIDALLTGGVR